jgi:hypothetical protein
MNNTSFHSKKKQTGTRIPKRQHPPQHRMQLLRTHILRPLPPTLARPLPRRPDPLAIVHPALHLVARHPRVRRVGEPHEEVPHEAGDVRVGGTA